MSCLLEVINARKYYGEKGCITQALENVSFSVKKGEFVGIMGASGSGKSTLLNCISTIDRLTGGQVLMEGKDITSLSGSALSDFRSKKLGFIFQEFNLLDTMTAYENIALPLAIQKRKPQEIDEKIRSLTELLMIGDVLDKYPYQMSGGQKQRVAAARAVITEPGLILADEPTGALDSKASRVLLESLSTMNRQMEATILMVTHDAFAASYADRILFIKDGKVFNELIREPEEPRKQFFTRIIEVVTLLGGELNELI